VVNLDATKLQELLQQLLRADHDQLFYIAFILVTLDAFVVLLIAWRAFTRGNQLRAEHNQVLKQLTQAIEEDRTQNRLQSASLVTMTEAVQRMDETLHSNVSSLSANARAADHLSAKLDLLPEGIRQPIVQKIDEALTQIMQLVADPTAPALRKADQN